MEGWRQRRERQGIGRDREEKSKEDEKVRFCGKKYFDPEIL